MIIANVTEVSHVAILRKMIICPTLVALKTSLLPSNLCVIRNSGKPGRHGPRQHRSSRSGLRNRNKERWSRGSRRRNPGTLPLLFFVVVAGTARRWSTSRRRGNPENHRSLERSNSQRCLAGQWRPAVGPNPAKRDWDGMAGPASTEDAAVPCVASDPPLDEEGRRPERRLVHERRRRRRTSAAAAAEANELVMGALCT